MNLLLLYGVCEPIFFYNTISFAGEPEAVQKLLAEAEAAIATAASAAMDAERAAADAAIAKEEAEHARRSVSLSVESWSNVAGKHLQKG